jgi:hypothetical protein
MTVWGALKAVNRKLPARVQRLCGRALDLVGVRPPRTTDDAAADWASRRGDEWLKRYVDTWDQPHRHLLVERVARFEPLSSVLELGCHAGPNLRLLADRFPDARITGTDVNLAAVEEARRSLAGLANVAVEHADLRVKDVSEVLGQAWRATRKALVLMEPQPAPDQLLSKAAGDTITRRC